MTTNGNEGAPQRVAVDAARRFVAAVLQASGMPQRPAGIVSDAMIEADIAGSDGHGLGRLPQYLNAIAKGEINLLAESTFTASGPCTAVVDAHNGFGHLAVSRAVDEAIAMAGQAGLAWVGVRNSNHAGAAGVYVARIAQAGKIGIYGAISGVNHMAPTGSSVPLLGTNPLAIAVPGPDGQCVLLDIAMSRASYGAIQKRIRDGQPLPADWLVDRATGEPTTDAQKLGDSLLCAMGDYKGVGLSFMIGLLAGPLNGAAFGADVPDFASGSSGFGVNSGQFVVAIDIGRFTSAERFHDQLRHHIQSIESSPRMAGATAVRWPGQARERRSAAAHQEGIAVSAPLLDALDGIAKTWGVLALERRK